MATIKVCRLSRDAKAALQILSNSNPDEYYFRGQKFHFPTERIADIADVTGCRRAAEYSTLDDTTLNLRYSFQNDTVKIWGETESGSIFSARLSDSEALEAIAACELAKLDSGYLVVSTDDYDRSFSLYDFCEEQTNFTLSEVADALFVGHLFATNAAIFAELEPIVLHPLAQVAAA